MTRGALRAIVSVTFAAIYICCAADAGFGGPSNAVLTPVFSDAKRIDLRTSDAPAVAKLREFVKVPAPSTPVLVKTFERDSLPQELAAAFAKRPDGMIPAGVTIDRRYIAIIRTDFPEQYQDVLNHELVHAYLALASPKPLPDWFHEGSAVHFSTDSNRSIYGRPSEKIPRATEIVVQDLPADYAHRLQNINFLLERSGPEKFYAWYRESIATGVVDARPLLGVKTKHRDKTPSPSGASVVWLGGVAGLVVAGVLIGGFFVARRSGDFGR